jgi:DUF3017 family protein
MGTAVTGRHADRGESGPPAPQPGAAGAGTGPPAVARPGRPELPGVGVLGEWPLVAVTSVCLTGLAVVLSNHFRRGTVLFAGGLFLAATLRAVLPQPAAGLLVVRSRVVDVLTLGVLAVSVVLTAVLVPPPS